MEDARQVDDNGQILLNVIDGRNHRMTKVGRQRNEELHRCGDANDRGRWKEQWYEFCKKIWEGIHNRMDEQIQVLGPHVPHDVLTGLNNGCESFRGALETQLCWVSDVQCQIVQGVQQFAHAVDNKLAQNDQSNDTQEGIIKELFTPMRNSVCVCVGGVDREESSRKHSYASKVTTVEQKLEGIGNAIEGEVSKGISSVAQRIDAKMHECANVEATLPREPIKSERSADLHPGLDLGKDNRRLGVRTKIEQPPETKKSQKMELDTD